MHLSQRQIHKISSRAIDVEALITRMRSAAKKDPTMIEKFKEYGIELDEIDGVDISFGLLDVSAKTKNLKITLNETMLQRGNEESVFKFVMPYLVHEATHYLQQRTNTNRPNKADDYMSKPSELESFTVQVDYKKRHEGKPKAKKYVEDLLDYHDLHGAKREKTERELLNNKDN